MEVEHLKIKNERVWSCQKHALGRMFCDIIVTLWHRDAAGTITPVPTPSTPKAVTDEKPRKKAKREEVQQDTTLKALKRQEILKHAARDADAAEAARREEMRQKELKAKEVAEQDAAQAAIAKKKTRKRIE